MIKTKFTVPIYNFDITLVQIENKDDYEPVKKLLKSINANKEDAEYTLENIKNEAVNGGDTYRDMCCKRFLVLFFPFTDEYERENTFDHEKRHVEDRMMAHVLVDDIESAGLLAGYLGVRFYKFKKLIDKLNAEQ